MQSDILSSKKRWSSRGSSLIYLFQTNWMELAMKFLMTRFFFYQKTHFSVEIFEMGFMQNILISSAGRPFILVPLVPAKITPH